MPPPLFIELIAFGTGLLLGSFLNVCIARLPQRVSIVHPRSHCPACGHAIRWYDNIPVLSWLLLRARCRDCKAPIPWTYPLVELAFALWMLRPAREIIAGFLAYSQPGSNPADVFVDAMALTILGFLLIGLLVMDWQTRRLPDAFTLCGIALGLFFTCAQAIFLRPGEGDIIFDSNRQLRLSSPGSFASQGNVFLTGAEALVFGRIAAVAGAALLLLLVRWLYHALRKREGMGLGDVKLFAMIAAFLGFGESLLALFLGVFAAALYGVTLLARRRAGAATRLPFGSFLAAGGMFAALFGARVVDWYSGLLR